MRCLMQPWRHVKRVFVKLRGKVCTNLRNLVILSWQLRCMHGWIWYTNIEYDVDGLLGCFWRKKANVPDGALHNKAAFPLYTCQVTTVNNVVQDDWRHMTSEGHSVYIYIYIDYTECILLCVTHLHSFLIVQFYCTIVSAYCTYKTSEFQKCGCP